jgi:hypothetical protein
MCSCTHLPMTASRITPYLRFGSERLFHCASRYCREGKHRRGVVRIASGNDTEHCAAISGTARHRPDVIERRCQFEHGAKLPFGLAAVEHGVALGALTPDIAAELAARRPG